MKDVFIIGSKGIPANYGGFETFVDNLTKMRIDSTIRYHVSCISDENNEFYYNEARCFNVKVPNIGSAKAVLYDILSIRECIKYIKKNKIDDATIYILACRMGPYLSIIKKTLEKLGIKIIINPDGHEWKRSKWNYFIKKYWKFSESIMVKHSNLVVCDSKGIQTYIENSYYKADPITTYISYGATVAESKFNESQLDEWYSRYEIEENEYYLIVGRFVPENNYEYILKEFMKSNTNKDLVIISNVENNKFYNELIQNTKFDEDKRIKFVGTVYDQEKLKKIRENAFAYIHGHEVGGTNPSLLEALASTKLNLLLDVVFNKEVGENGALYFSKDTMLLSILINDCESINQEKINSLSKIAKERINTYYSWEKIITEYENLFKKINKELKQ